MKPIDKKNNVLTINGTDRLPLLLQPIPPKESALTQVFCLNLSLIKTENLLSDFENYSTLLSCSELESLFFFISKLILLVSV